MPDKALYDQQHAWICEHILTSLPGADPNHVHRTFVRKTDHFLQQSASWIEDETFESDEHGNVKLDYSGIDGQLVFIMAVWHANLPVQYANWVTEHYKNQRSMRPVYYSNTPYPDVLLLSPMPKEDESFTVGVRAALTLNDCADGEVPIPDWLFSRYKEAIREGVLGDMMRESGKAYTDKVEGRLRSATYNQWIAKARDEARVGQGQHEPPKMNFNTGFIPAQ